jgi:hypothetical protein
MICPCGCGAGVHAPNKYATRACWHRVLTPAIRAAWATNWRRTDRPRRRCQGPGCDVVFVVTISDSRRGRRRFCSLACWNAFKRTDPDYRAHDRARMRRSGDTRRRRAAARRKACGDRYPTKGDAYAAGYAQGYRTAYAAWQPKRRT